MVAPHFDEATMTLTAILIIIGRFLLGGHFLQAGIRNFTKLELHTGILSKKNIPMPRESAVVAIVVQILGGASVAFGIFPAIGAIGLILFTLGASALYHDFWSYSESERSSHLGAWLTNGALIGGFLLVIAIS
jgi:putative oxidoreductase